MGRVRSEDGTSIAYDRRGRGPAVILVGGGLDDGSENAPLIPGLAEHFTVYNFARRGRGGSLAGSSEEDVAGARNSPFWSGGEAIAHTLAYDAACLGDGQPPTARLAKITQPALVATGVEARLPGAAAWVLALDQAADAIAASIPHAERRIFEGQSHVADPAAVVPVLKRFFRE
jgi:pimeloyl-ACP methyl ester carboxylesterase